MHFFPKIAQCTFRPDITQLCVYLLTVFCCLLTILIRTSNSYPHISSFAILILSKIVFLTSSQGLFVCVSHKLLAISGPEVPLFPLLFVYTLLLVTTRNKSRIESRSCDRRCSKIITSLEWGTFPLNINFSLSVSLALFLFGFCCENKQEPLMNLRVNHNWEVWYF